MPAILTDHIDRETTTAARHLAIGVEIIERDHIDTIESIETAADGRVVLSVRRQWTDGRGNVHPLPRVGRTLASDQMMVVSPC